MGKGIHQRGAHYLFLRSHPSSLGRTRLDTAASCLALRGPGLGAPTPTAQHSAAADETHPPKENS